MTVRAEGFKVLFYCVHSIAVDVVDLKRDATCNRMILSPAALRALVLCLGDDVVPYRLGNLKLLAPDAIKAPRLPVLDGLLVLVIVLACVRTVFTNAVFSPPEIGLTIMASPHLLCGGQSTTGLTSGSLVDP